MAALVEEVKAKYGIELACGDDRCEDEPEGFVHKDPPKKLKDPHYRYCPSGKFGTHFEDWRPLTMWYGKWYYIGVSEFKEGLCLS